jgi:hypothetical protein
MTNREPKLWRCRMPLGVKPTQVSTLFRKTEWVHAEPHADSRCKPAALIQPAEHAPSCSCTGAFVTFGKASEEPFFSQPATLSFDPDELPEEQGPATLRQVFALPAAAIMWMAIGTRHLRSQYFASSVLDVAWQLERAGDYALTGTNLHRWACVQSDGAVAKLKAEQWETLIPWLKGEQSFAYTVLLGPDWIDKKAEYVFFDARRLHLK